MKKIIMLIALLAILLIACEPATEPIVVKDTSEDKEEVKKEAEEPKTSEDNAAEALKKIKDKAEEQQKEIEEEQKEKETEDLSGNETVSEAGDDSPPLDFFILSVAEQQRFLPRVEEAVKNSPCYDATWKGIEQFTNVSNRPISVDRKLRFQYIENHYFKGWIDHSLMYSNALLARETTAFTVEDLKVECSETESFEIDWERALSKFTR